MKKRIFMIMMVGALCISNVFSVFATELVDEALPEDDLSVELIQGSADEGISAVEESSTDFASSNAQSAEYSYSDTSEKTTKYSIKFFGNGNTSGKMSAVKNVKYDKTVTLPKNKFKKTGYVFVCWNTKIDGSGKAYTNGQKVKGLSKKDNGTVNLYAMWSLKNAPDLSEYVKKSDVQKIVDAAVTQAVTEAVKNIKVEGKQGPKGDPGRGIKSTSVDKDGNLIVTYTDGEKVNVGVVKGPKGDKGENGSDGSAIENAEDNQKIGYVVPITCDLPSEYKDQYTQKNSIKITNMEVRLAKFDHSYTKKYVYKCTISYNYNIQEVHSPSDFGYTSLSPLYLLLVGQMGRDDSNKETSNYIGVGSTVPDETGSGQMEYTGYIYTEDPLIELKTIYTQPAIF